MRIRGCCRPGQISGSQALSTAYAMYYGTTIYNESGVQHVDDDALKYCTPDDHEVGTEAHSRLVLFQCPRLDGAMEFAVDRWER